LRVERPVSLGTLVPSPLQSARDLPGYAAHAAEIAGKGVDTIADGDASFTKAVGLEIEVDRNALGLRSQRCGVRARSAVDPAGRAGQRDARRVSVPMIMAAPHGPITQIGQ
jgi:hypothetical protein